MAAEPEGDWLMGARSGRRRVRMLAGAIASLLVASAALLASGAFRSGSSTRLPTVNVRGAVVPIPNGWHTVRAAGTFTIVSARPQSGLGQESVQVGQTVSDPHTLASEFAQVAQLDNPGAKISAPSARAVTRARSCWLVTASYQLPRQGAELRLQSLDLFCSRRNGTVAHVNLVLPDTATNASLARRFLLDLSL